VAAEQNVANDASGLQTIRLGNQDFSVRRVSFEVDRLKLDPNNPRLGFLLSQRSLPATDPDLHEMLWDLDPLKSLYQSILQNGGLIVDPIIHADGDVVEGNCRTVCLRELRKKYPSDSRWEKVWVRVLPKGVSDEQVMLLLGEIHIAGKIEWRALDQAEYVWRMNKKFGKNYDFLASHLRWSRSKLVQKIAAYEEARNYIARTNDPQGINRFSHFEEFMKKKELRDRFENEPRFMERFHAWVQAGKFPNAVDVRLLPEILKNEEATKALERSGVEKARAVLIEKDPSLRSNLYSIVDQAAQELETISLDEIQALQDGDEARLAKLRRLRKALDTLTKYVGKPLA
jgi:hypothetical protein